MKFHKFLNYLNRKAFLFNLKYYSYEKQLKYLNSFPQPRDDIERSYFQYKCQVFLSNGLFLFFLKNIFSFFITTFYLIKIRNCSNVKNITVSDNVLVGAKSLFDFLPEDYKKPKEPLRLELIDSLSLSKSDRKFVYLLIRRYPFSWYFIFKVMMKLAYYSSVIDRYSPKNILVSSEYSFTSSILTHYCENKNIKHINFMHGEKIYNIRESFCRFTEFYIWDEYYKALFVSLKSAVSKYIINYPFRVINEITEETDANIEKADYKFYLAIETKDSLEKLKRVVSLLRDNDFNVVIRPHPLYTNLKLLNSYFEEHILENSMVNIISSIMSAHRIVSIGSTVLYQAFKLNKKIIIDDITQRERFKYFKDNKYIMFTKEHYLLSEILKNVIKES